MGRFRFFIGMLALGMASSLACPGSTGQAGSKLPAQGHASSTKSVPAPAPLPVPFQPGERLTYRITWGPAEAASAELEILPQQFVAGHNAWHFQAKANTIKTTRFIYPLDDQFDSYSDESALDSLQYEMYIREPGKNRDRIIRMNREGKPAPPAPSVRVPAGTRDPLGLVYALRAFDWSKSKETKFPVYDGGKLYEVRARQLSTGGKVSVPKGTYTASRIELRVFERNKEVTTARFWVWLASDAARTPVLIEAELPFGSIRVELVSSRTE